jgi:hypothetical protein
MQVINIFFYSNLLFDYYFILTAGSLLIQFIEVKRIVFLASISFSNIAAEGQKQVSSKLNVRITYPPPRQQVPIGNTLTIFGTSTHNATKDHPCHVPAPDCLIST